MRYAVTKGLATLVFSALFVTQSMAIEVYLFKGAGDFSFVNENMHFSRGLNKIADTLEAEGIHAEVRRFSAIEDALQSIRQRKPSSIALIGHSMGALASMAMARNLRGEGIRIAYMGLIDIPGPVGVAGDNVEWVENYYSINPVYGRLTNVKTHPNAKNIHVLGYIHNRMDDAPKVQGGMLAAIRTIHQQEQQLQGGEPPVLTLEAALPVREVQVERIVQTQAPTETNPVTPEPLPVTTDIVETDQTPYALPSVSGQQVLTVESQDPLLNQQIQAYQPPVASAGQTAGLEPPLPISGVDPITTSSVSSTSQVSILERGKRLLRRTGAFVRGLSSGKRKTSVAPRRQIDP